MAKKQEKTQSQADLKEQVVLKALELAEERGWNTITLSDLAEACEISLPQLFDVVEDKMDILVCLGRMIDKRVLVNVAAPDPSVPLRDQLFDVLMERFEVLNDYRGGVVAILKSFCFDPKQAVISCPHLARSMTWMLEASGVETTGIRGAIKVAGATGLYLKVLRVWKDDESPDLGKTMAALDKDLGRAESVINTFGL